MLHQRTAEELQITHLYWHAQCFIYWVDSFMLTLILLHSVTIHSLLKKANDMIFINYPGVRCTFLIG